MGNKQTRDTRRYRKHNHEHSHEYGQSWSIAAALLDGPKDFDELAEYFRIMARRFGIFVDLLDRGKNPPKGPAKADGQSSTTRGQSLSGRELETSLARSLEFLLRREWIVRQDDHYHLTETGRKQAHIMIEDLERGGRFINDATRPETVSKVTLIVHFVLAAIKLPAALLSGSVGLLNDALDTLMDGISSLFVFFGVRSGREREVSYVLLAFMGITGLYSLYEAVSRFFKPAALSADFTAFAAVAVSGLLCALLWVYQKYAGLKHSCMPLIAQSVDSRNHVIVAGGVAAGLAAVFFKFPLLDRLVGLTVAILILKGAVELLIDLARSSGEEEIDLSRYGFSRLERHRTRQMVRWFLFEIEKGRITSREEMLEEARVATDFSRIASLRALGMDVQPGQEEKIREAAEELFSKGLVKELARSTESSGLYLSPAGEAELRTALADSWSFSGNPRTGGVRSVPLKVFALLLRLIVSAALFAGIFALGRLLIDLLPPFDIWNSLKGHISPIPEAVGGVVSDGAGALESLRVGPFLIHRAQFLCVIIGFGLYHLGRRFMHQARHTLRHARVRGRRDRSGVGLAKPTDKKGDRVKVAKQDSHDGRQEREKPLFLITEGPFARRRHPMYAGFILISLGIGIGLYSGYTLIWAGLAVLVQLIGAAAEERRLSRWFGSEYRDYSARVKRRFFPWWGWGIPALLYAAAWAGAW